MAAAALSTAPDSRVWHRAVDTRDPRFDGVFFVAIVTTGIYCRPVCPSRRARPSNRRFFRTRQASEAAGFRPCRRCRPDSTPGVASCDALRRLARRALARIDAGALDGGSVGDLARALGVSPRHLRRALAQEAGASPIALAQRHRLDRARRLLADRSRSITHVAFESGFQSVRRFNALFQRQYGTSPSALRREAAQ
ncbi:MAG TPA: Ada metal-binding domain-containing protein [Gemmatimonadaceae bacterium]|nr:Ada metal-binding domain-containing protein [Gemmatimonadaceae bacterium]